MDDDCTARFGLGRKRYCRDYLDYMVNVWNIIVYDLEDDHDVGSARMEAELSVLKVKKVNLNIRTNTREHHTDEFDITDVSKYDAREDLVLRRGQKFNITITFNREYNEKEDDLRLIFTFGKQPNETKGTAVEFILSAKDNPNEWGAYIQSKDGNSVSFVFMTPPTCAVGKWELQIGVVKPRDTKDTKPNLLRYKHKFPIYILFNPWCKDDQVYMKEDQLLNEYVLNQNGRIYKSSYSFANWKFGQFSGNVLDCVLYLLDKQFRAKLPDHSRGDPVLVVRTLSSLVNDFDNSGVLSGNWSGDYKGGVSPSHWAGSVAILEQFYKTKCPVNFGQCWVFSGVLTTVCRALGIPARSVTNLGSAHDTDVSCTIDNYCDEDGEEIDEMNSDSVWNFHVWNDVWMARPELPSGYGGWQAIDATPQEASGGIHCMGPMPVLGIKRGDLNLQYDGQFAFAEVNADTVYWRRDATTKHMSVISVSTDSVGRGIVTKLPNAKDREFITDQYKYKEGTPEERAAVRNASTHSKMRTDYVYDDVYAKVKAEDSVDFNLELGKAIVGEPLTLRLKVNNKTNSKKTLSGTLKLSSMYYTGIPYLELWKEKSKNIILNPNEEMCISMDMPVGEYWGKTMDHCIFRLACVLLVKETKQTYIQQKELEMEKPHLKIEAPAAGSIGKKFEVKVSFKNPLPMALTNCQLIVEGPGLQQQKAHQQPDIGPNQTFSGKFTMTPMKSSEAEIIVSFNSDQLCNIEDSHTLKIIK